MPEDNIWLTGRRRELASLEAIIERLSAPNTDETGTIAGPGTTSRGATPVTIVTDGAHAAILRESTAGRLNG